MVGDYAIAMMTDDGTELYLADEGRRWLPFPQMTCYFAADHDAAAVVAGPLPGGKRGRVERIAEGNGGTPSR